MGIPFSKKMSDKTVTLEPPDWQAWRIPLLFDPSIGQNCASMYLDQGCTKWGIWVDGKLDQIRGVTVDDPPTWSPTFCFSCVMRDNPYWDAIVVASDDHVLIMAEDKDLRDQFDCNFHNPAAFGGTSVDYILDQGFWEM